MKIVVLNECFLSPSQLDQLRSLSEVETFSDATLDAATAIKRIKDADIVLADMFECPLTAEVIKSNPKLKLLCVNSTSYEKIDLDAARENNTSVANTPGLATVAVAEHVFALILSLTRKIIPLHEARQKGDVLYIDPANQDQKRFLGMNLQGKTLGIFGLGAIGTHIAKIAQGFGMNVVAHSRSPKSISGVTMVSLDELLAQSDILTLNAYKNAESDNLLNGARLAKMKKGAIVINNGFTGCVDSNALAKALDSGHIAAAGMDVLEDGSSNNPLFNRDNVIITPADAWFTRESLENIARIMTETVVSFTKGAPINVVS